MPGQDSTTVRISRRTHQTLTELAERRDVSVTDLLNSLVERERRTEMLSQYNRRMAEVLADPAEREAWVAETSRSETAAGELTGGDAPAVAR